MRSIRTSRVALTAVFVALAAALGFLLLSVPNVELITFTVFAAGTLLGRSGGALVGALAFAIFSGFHPMGSGVHYPPGYVAQIGAAALVGLAGGASRALWRPGRASGRPWVMALVGGAFGFTLTVIFQVLVSAGYAMASPDRTIGLVAALVSNAVFSAVHVVSNTIVFSALAPAVLPRLQRLRPDGAP
jgi:hypothetical protein